MQLRNKTRGASKIGYLVKAVRGGFEYAGLGDTPIGVVTEVVPSGSMCEIQTSGDAKVYVVRTVSEGDDLRLTTENEGGNAGVAYPVGSTSAYIAIGSVIKGGRGLVDVALNIASAGSFSGGGTGLPDGGTTGQVLTKDSAVDGDASWQDNAAFVDAPSDGTGYIRVDALWASSALLIDYTGGTGSLYENVQYGEALSFSGGGTGMAVNYTKTQVGPPGSEVWTHNFEFTYTPLGNYYDGFYVQGDTSDSPVLIGSTNTLDILGSAYINTSYNFTTADPPLHELTIEIDTPALRGHLDSYYYDFVTYPNLINGDVADDGSGYWRVNSGWQQATLGILWGGGSFTDQIDLRSETLEFAADGTGLSVAYDNTTNKVTYTFTPLGNYYDGFYVQGDVSDSPVLIGSTNTLDIVGGDYVNTAYDFVTGDPPDHTLTINVDYAGMEAAGLFYSKADVNTLIEDFIVDAENNSNAYVRYKETWQIAGLNVDGSGESGTVIDKIGYEDRLAIVSGSAGLSVNYTDTAYGGKFTIAYTPLGNYYDGWFIAADSGSGISEVASNSHVTFIGGTNISTVLAYATPGGTPPVTADITINLDSNISLTSVTTTTGIYTNNIYERSSGSGVTIDSVLVKDGAIRTGTPAGTPGVVIYNSSSSSESAVLRLQNYNTGQSAGAEAGKIEFYKSDASTQGAGVVSSIRSVTIDAGGSYNLEFNTGQDVDTPAGTNGQMTLTYEGALVIGDVATHSAGKLLEVDGGAEFNAGVLFWNPNTTDGVDKTRFVYNHSSTQVFSMYYYDQDNVVFRDVRFGQNNANKGIYFDASIDRVGISDDTPSYTLDVNGSIRGVSSVLSSGEITAYSSDGRLKTDVMPIYGALELIDAIHGVTFRWRDDVDMVGFKPSRDKEHGFIAQNIQTHFPEGVAPAPFDHDESGKSISGNNYLTVKPEKLIPIHHEAIRELHERIKELESKLAVYGAR